MANIQNRRILDRAMQFAPFAALKGYYETVRMQERITQPKKELGDDAAELIWLCEKISVNSKTVIKVIYWSD